MDTTLRVGRKNIPCSVPYVLGPNAFTHSLTRLASLPRSPSQQVDLLTSLETVTADGRLTVNNTHRSFQAFISVKPTLITTVQINITCIAPIGAFVFLEKEGHTYIHSTVMGDCTAVIKKPLQKAQTYMSTGVNLIESKEWSDPYHWAAFQLIGDWR